METNKNLIMKKYLFGLFAIALAIGFSAFTTRKSQRTDDAYWYKIDNLGKVVSGGIYGFVSRETSESNSGCNGSQPTDCVRGYNTDPAYSVGQTTSSSADFFIQKN